MTAINIIGNCDSELGRRRQETGIFSKVSVGGSWHSIHWSHIG